MTMRWWALPVAALLVACGDDTGGSGGSGSGGSGATGSGGGATTTTATTSSGEGGGTTSSGEGGGTTSTGQGGGTTSTGQGGGTTSAGQGGGDTLRDELVAACESAGANSSDVADALGCPPAEGGSCEDFADSVEGCEAEFLAVIECLDAETTVENCSCDGGGGAGGGESLQCAVSEECDAALTDATDCLP